MTRFSFACLPLNTLSGDPLHFLPAIFALPSPLLEEEKSASSAYHINSCKIVCFVRGKTFGHAQMTGAKFLIFASMTRLTVLW
jgi:hypothetical protein